MKRVIFDFDGVLTNNYVYVNSDGTEFVRFSLLDGLAIDALKTLEVNTLILSTERNTIVQARSNKLKTPVIQKVKNKLEILNDYRNNNSCSFDDWYVGNDVNDINVIKASGKSFCYQINYLVKELVDVILSKKGGDGVIRELVETIMSINIYEILYK